MKFRRILTAVLAVLMLATCMSFTAGAEGSTPPSVVYVQDGGAGTMDGLTKANAIGTFAEAYALVADGGKIVLAANTTIASSYITPAAKTVTVTALDPEAGTNTGARIKIDNTYSGFTNDTPANAGTGTIKIENVAIYGLRSGSYFGFGGMNVEIGNGVSTPVGDSYKRPIYVAGSYNANSAFGNSKIVLKSGEGTFYLGTRQLTNAGNARNVNLELLGGTYDLVLGHFTTHGQNVLMQVSILADVAPKSVSTSMLASINRGVNFIGNNGVVVKFDSLKDRNNAALPIYGTSHYIYSGEGGRVDFIYTTDDKGIKTTSGKYTISSDSQKALVKYPDGSFKTITLTANTAPDAEFDYTGTLAKEDASALDAGTYYVSYADNPVVLNFYENKNAEDTTVATVVVNGNETNISTAVTTPANTGYTFGGWYTNKECTGEAVDLTNFTYSESATSFYAKWTAQLTVTFDAKNGTTPVAITFDADDTDISDLVSTPTYDGYRFIEWNTKNDGTGTRVNLANYTYDAGATTLYAIWLSTDVYVNGTASENGNGEQATPYNNFADAWNAIKETGGKITLTGNTNFDAYVQATNKTITITASDSSYVLDFAGKSFGKNGTVTGKVVFENITLKSESDVTIDFEGMSYEFGTGVATTGAKKPSFRGASTETKFGDTRNVIKSGDFNVVRLGCHFIGYATAKEGDINLEVLGGSVNTINAGYSHSHGGNNLKNVNIRLDVQPINNVIASDFIANFKGAYQLIANNGVQVTPTIKNRNNEALAPTGGMYEIYSAQGGTVEFVYGDGATTATVGTYKVTSDKKYAIITNLDTGVATQQDLTAAGGTTLTLTAGKYSIGYANDPATLNFFYNDGTDGKQTVLIEKTATDITASVVTPTYAGNRFLGWNTAADGTGEYLDLTNYAHDDASTTFYAIWDTFVVYVDGSAAVNGVGTEAAPYNNLTDAWNALKDSDDVDNVIVISGNVELPSGLDNVKNHIIITSKEGEKARLMLSKGAIFSSANGNRGIVVFDDIYFQADATESINFGGMSYYFTENVVTVGSYKPTLRSAVNMEKFGDNEIAIAGGTFDTIVLGNNYSQNDVNNGNINFALYGGTVRYVNVGYSLKGGHWSNVLRNVNVLLDVAPTDGIGSIGVESMSGTYQFIANNGVKTAPGMATRAGAELVPAERKYLLYSAEGGRLDFIYEADAITAVVGKFLASSDRQTVVVINRDTLEVTEFPVVAGEAEITLAPGVYDISYTGDVVAPPTPSNPEDMAGAVVSILFNKLTVSFETDGGSKVAAQQVMIGGKVAKPAIDPVKAGYKFDGWYANKEFTKKFNFLGTQISANTTIYAKWTADAAQSIVLTIDSAEASVFGKKVTNDVAPIIKNDRTMLPARFVAESLGAKVEWFEYERKVVITSADKNTIITLFIDSATAYINGVAYTLDAPAFIENSRTYTPVRFIAEALGADVEWNAETREVTIIK